MISDLVLQQRRWLRRRRKNNVTADTRKNKRRKHRPLCKEETPFHSVSNVLLVLLVVLLLKPAWEDTNVHATKTVRQEAALRELQSNNDNNSSISNNNNDDNCSTISEIACGDEYGTEFGFSKFALYCQSLIWIVRLIFRERRGF